MKDDEVGPGGDMYRLVVWWFVGGRECADDVDNVVRLNIAHNPIILKNNQ